MAYIDSFNLSQNSTFRGKIQIAIATAAKDIRGESPSDNEDLDLKRSELAFQVLRNPLEWIDIFSINVCTNPVINESSTDADIQFTVNSLWNDIAGV